MGAVDGRTLPRIGRAMGLAVFPHDKEVMVMELEAMESEAGRFGERTVSAMSMAVLFHETKLIGMEAMRSEAAI